ncbi:hypothetical protein [Mycobacterium sp. 23]|uniref:8-oxoguanine DNA glycosylase OGG fold protein n=1 Tax=Mycobacterium sp. 23 TaxID=3400424 RepID=UPI003AACA76D
MGREDLFARAAKARESGKDEHFIDLFWHILAWGVVGNFRNASQIVQKAIDEGPAHLLAALRPAAESSYLGDIEGGYRAFIDNPISRFNYAFFSKFLYFTGSRLSRDARCLIFDDRVASALLAITGESYVPGGRRPWNAYAKYCRDVHGWSNRYGVEADEIEWRLYKLGQLIGFRANWLAAEVSLYREGLTPVTFDSIVERVAHRRSAP